MLTFVDVHAFYTVFVLLIVGGLDECDIVSHNKVISYMGDAHFATVNF